MSDMGTRFRRLHIPGRPFVLANVCDLGSAKMMVALGAEAIATSSGAHAFTLGRCDGGTVSREEALDHAAALVDAVDVPVQGDFEDGFVQTPDQIGETVLLAAEVGLAGICLEDTDLVEGGSFEFAHALGRIEAAVEAARSLKHDFVITARADGVLIGSYGFDEALRRVQAFQNVGADCLYVPGLASLAELERLCCAVTAPVNALISGHSRHGIEEFAAVGVSRISLGSSLARATHKLTHDIATSIFSEGDFSALSNILPSAITDKILNS